MRRLGGRYQQDVSGASRRMKWSLEKRVVAGVSVALLVLIANAFVSYRATRTLIANENWVTHTYQVLSELEAVISAMKDAETGQRGFIITGREDYLDPYRSAVSEINTHLDNLKRLSSDNVENRTRIPILEGKVVTSLAKLTTLIDLRRGGDFEAVRRQIASGSEKEAMDDLRAYVSLLEDDERDLLRQRAVQSAESARNTILTFVIANLTAFLLLTVTYVVIVRDINARREAEEEIRRQREWLRITLSSIGDAVIATDTESKVTFLNPVAEALTGWTLGEAEGQPVQMIFNIVNEETRQQVDNPVLRTMREGVIVGLANHTTLIARHGKQISIDDSAAPITDQAGKVIGAVLIFRDISERRRAEDERSKLLASERAARERAEAASRAKDEFVAMVSHEVRAPLNSILGWAQVLRSGNLDEAARANAVETIERNARNQARLIDDLLDISRVITGKLNLNVRPVEMSAIIDAGVDSIRPAAEAKGINLKLNIDPEAKGRLVSGDTNRLQQIVWNLLSNAVKFTPKQGLIEIGLSQIDSHLELRVRDTGAGISPEFLPYVFDRFSQANSTSERKYGGLGLGLSIVRHLVEMHGGVVQADSPGEGGGSTFTVRLPIRVVREKLIDLERERLAEGDVVSLSNSIRLDGLRILAIDDEAGTRDLLLAILTQRGAEVRTASSAEQALDELKRWLPDVIVSDIGMPGEDGYSLMARIRRLGCDSGGDIPAIALTAYARSEDRMRALAAGFQMHVPKPVEAFELIIVIATLAGRSPKRLSSSGD
jgi:PAS domain S-box-containing protein